MEPGDLTQVTEGLKGLKKETTKVGQNTSNLYKELKKTSESQVSEIKKLGEKVQKMGNKHIAIDPKSLKGIGDQFGKAIETKKSVFDNSKQIGKAFEKVAGGKKGSRERELAEETARQGRKDFAESQKNREETNSILSKLLKNSNRSLKETLKDKTKNAFGGGIIGDIVGELLGSLLAKGALGKIFKKGSKFLKNPMRNMKAAKLRKTRNLSRKGLKRTKSGRIDLRQKGAKNIIKSGGKSAAKGATKGAAKGALKGAAKVGLKVLGPVAVAAGLAMDAMDVANAEVGKKGGAIGKVAGGAIGAGIGAAFAGPVGAMIGQQVGSWVGGAIGEQFDDVDSNKAGKRLAAEMEEQKEEYNEAMEERRAEIAENNKKLAQHKAAIEKNKNDMVAFYDRQIAEAKDSTELEKLEVKRADALRAQETIIAGLEATNAAANAALKAEMDALTAEYDGDLAKAAEAKIVLDKIKAKEEEQKKAAADKAAAEEAMELANTQLELTKAKLANEKDATERDRLEKEMKAYKKTIEINNEMMKDAEARNEKAQADILEIKEKNKKHQKLWATGFERFGNSLSDWWKQSSLKGLLDKIKAPSKSESTRAQPVASGGFIPKAASGRGIYEVNEQGMESFTGQDGKTYLINPNKGTINNANRTKQLLDGSQKASMQQGGGGAPSIIPMPTPPQKDDSKKSEKKQQNVTNYIDSYTLKAAIGRSAVMV